MRGLNADGVPSVRVPAPLPDGVSQATIGVRGGLLRSEFEETAEAMFLTSGYVYESAAAAEQAFTGEIDRYVLSAVQLRTQGVETAPARATTPASPRARRCAGRPPSSS